MSSEVYVLVPSRDLYCPAVQGTFADALRAATDRAYRYQTSYTVMAHRPGGLYRIDVYPVAVVDKYGRITSK